MVREYLTPREIVSELDKYIIGQKEAKRTVAIALRNRWRRQQVPADLRDEIAPKNIIMIGPTGVGKTEIARRLARLAESPFLKVEVTKFTEVGYVGRDVESMIRDLIELAINLVKSSEKKEVLAKAEEVAEERLLDLLLPPKAGAAKNDNGEDLISAAPSPEKAIGETSSTREKLRSLFRDGKLAERYVDLEVTHRAIPSIEIFSNAGLEEMDLNLKDMFGNLFPKKTKQRKMKVPEAFQILVQEESQRLIDMDKVTEEAVRKVEQTGIIFLDEIDKIAARGSGHGPDVSREGVQRDLLPIVEGSTVTTKYGLVRTDHILFIASGAFHNAKPSDLIPELQGRFPIRVELDTLSEEDFFRILTEPQSALTTQYKELMKTEGIDLIFTREAVAEIARTAYSVNQRTENIGARRLHTVIEKLLHDLSFEAPDMEAREFVVTDEYVRSKLSAIEKDEDFSRYIL